MVAFTTRMNSGFPGRVSRADEETLTIETQLIDPAAPPTIYGQLVKMVAGKIRAIAHTDVIATVGYGLLVCPYPALSTSTGFGSVTPPIAGPCDIMKRGYMTVLLADGTPVAGDLVYVRKTTNGAKIAGVFEVGALGGEAEVLSGAYFLGPKDSNNIVEIAYNI